MGNKKLIITIIILSLIVLGLGAYIIFDKYMENKTDNNSQTIIDDVSVNLNIFYQIGDTLKKFDDAFNDVNSTYFGYIYKNDLEVSKFDSGAALFATIYGDLVGSNTTQYLIGAKVKNKYEKIFGNKLKYIPTSIDAGEYYKITYNSDSNTYSYTAPTINNVYSAGYVAKNIKTTLENGKVIVTRRVFYVEYGSNNGGTDITKATIYKNSDKKQKIGDINLVNNALSENEVIAKFGSKLNMYNFTFIENSDDDYTFESIKLVK